MRLFWFSSAPEGVISFGYVITERQLHTYNYRVSGSQITTKNKTTKKNSTSSHKTFTLKPCCWQTSADWVLLQLFYLSGGSLVYLWSLTVFLHFLPPCVKLCAEQRSSSSTRCCSEDGQWNSKRWESLGPHWWCLEGRQTAIWRCYHPSGKCCTYRQCAQFVYSQLQKSHSNNWLHKNYFSIQPL